jgi:hypothetical protein
MRNHVRAVLGVDPLGRDGASRWTEAAIDVYRDGIFTTGDHQ